MIDWKFIRAVLMAMTATGPAARQQREGKRTRVARRERQTRTLNRGRTELGARIFADCCAACHNNPSDRVSAPAEMTASTPQKAFMTNLH
jgi:cytochrome c5